MRATLLILIGILLSIKGLGQSIPVMDEAGTAPWEATPATVGKPATLRLWRLGEAGGSVGLAPLVQWLNDRDVPASEATAADRDRPYADLIAVTPATAGAATEFQIMQVQFGLRQELMAWGLDETGRSLKGWRQAAALDKTALGMDSTHAVPDGPWQPDENALLFLAADIARPPTPAPALRPLSRLRIHVSQLSAATEDTVPLMRTDAGLTLEADAAPADATTAMSLPMDDAELAGMAYLWLASFEAAGIPSTLVDRNDAAADGSLPVSVAVSRTAAGYTLRVWGNPRPRAQVSMAWSRQLGPILPDDLAETVRRLVPGLPPVVSSRGHQSASLLSVFRAARSPVIPLAWREARLQLAATQWPVARGDVAAPRSLLIDPRRPPLLEPRPIDVAEWAIRLAPPPTIQTIPSDPQRYIYDRGQDVTTEVSGPDFSIMRDVKPLAPWSLTRTGSDWLWLSQTAIHLLAEGQDEPRQIALPSPAYAGPLVVGGRVIVGDDTGRLAAYDIATGTPAWAAEVAGRLRGPIVQLNDRTALACTDVGGLLALDVADGTIRWRLQLDDAPATAPLVGADGMWVLVATRGKSLYGIDGRDGDLRQTTKLTAPLLVMQSIGPSPQSVVGVGQQTVVELIMDNVPGKFSIRRTTQMVAPLCPWAVYVPDSPVHGNRPTDAWRATPGLVVGDVFGFVYVLDVSR